MAQYYLSLAARLAIVSIESGLFPSTREFLLYFSVQSKLFMRFLCNKNDN